MSTIMIEKYKDGVCVEKLQLPAAPVRCLARLLPSKARHALLSHGLDLTVLLNDISRSEPQWMEITEKNVVKRIRISRLD